MNAKLCFILLVLPTSLLLGCNGLTEQQRLWLAEGERAYQAERYDQAVQHLTRFVNAAGDRPELGRALYTRSLAHARSGRRTEARSDLVGCVNTAADRDVRWRAFTVLGTLDFEDRQWDTASRAYAAAAEIAPRVPPTDTVLFRLGLCHERTGRWAAARAPYQRIVKEFPASSVAAAARRRLQINATHFAAQCGVFGDKKNADYLVTQLERDGLDAWVRMEPRNGVPMHVVLVGRHSNYDESLRELARVKGYVPKAVLWP